MNLTSAQPKATLSAPTSSTPTYADIIKTADKVGVPFVDDATPEGHFGLAVHNMGGFQTYWFRGDVTTPDDAQVAGRWQQVNAGSPVTEYAGGGIAGGTFVGVR